MITTILILYISALTSTIVAVWCAAIVQRLRTKHLRRLEEVLSQRYMRIVTAIILSDDSLPYRFPMLEYRGAREILARVLAVASRSVYGPDTAIIGRIAINNGIDIWLLHKTRHSRGFRRAYYISLLAALPLTSGIIDQVARYDNDKNRFVRFYTLLIRISNDTSSALRSLAEFKESLNDFEIAEIMAMLRRGLLPVACEPLLASNSRNLRILGLNIAREFGVEETKPLLLEIAASEDDTEIAQTAIYALVAMRSSLANRRIAASIRNMPTAERRTLCRHLALEGYSASALGRLFGAQDGQFAKHLVATYKSRIICTPQL